MSASIGSIFAELRQEDRVVAIDADTSFGKLGSRVDPKAMGSYWELASDQHLETFADVRSRVGNNAAGPIGAVVGGAVGGVIGGINGVLGIGPSYAAYPAEESRVYHHRVRHSYRHVHHAHTTS